MFAVSSVTMRPSSFLFWLEKVGEPRDGGSDALDLVTMDTRRLTTSSSAGESLMLLFGYKLIDNLCTDALFQYEQ